METVNGIDPESYLRYLDFLIGRRHAELVTWSPDVHMGPEHSKTPLTAAHYELNQAAGLAVGKMAASIGVDIYAYSRGQVGKPDTRTFLSVFEDRGVRFPRTEKEREDEFEPIHTSRENFAALDAMRQLSMAAHTLGFRGSDPAAMADFLCQKLGFNMGESESPGAEKPAPRTNRPR